MIRPLDATADSRPVRPSAAFMLSHPAHLIALGLGSGLAAKAPGTVGSLWAWASWLVIQHYLSIPAQAALIALALLLGWWACTVTAANMRISDPGAIVWDEVIAVWLIFSSSCPRAFGVNWPLLSCSVFLMPSNPAPSLGPINFSKALVGAAAGGSSGTTWWPLFAPCCASLFGGGFDAGCMHTTC